MSPQELAEVPKISSGRPEKWSSHVSALAFDLQTKMKALAGFPLPHGEMMRAIECAARRVGITARAARALIYAESENPSGRVVAAVLAAHARLEAKQAEKEAKARDDYQRLTDRLDELESSLRTMARAAALGPSNRTDVEGAEIEDARAEARPMDRRNA